MPPLKEKLSLGISKLYRLLLQDQKLYLDVEFSEIMKKRILFLLIGKLQL